MRLKTLGEVGEEVRLTQGDDRGRDPGDVEPWIWRQLGTSIWAGGLALPPQGSCGDRLAWHGFAHSWRLSRRRAGIDRKCLLCAAVDGVLGLGPAMDPPVVGSTEEGSARYNDEGLG